MHIGRKISRDFKYGYAAELARVRNFCGSYVGPCDLAASFVKVQRWRKAELSLKKLAR